MTKHTSKGTIYRPSGETGKITQSEITRTTYRPDPKKREFEVDFQKSLAHSSGNNNNNNTGK